MAYLLQSMNKTKTEESKHEEVKIGLSNWKQVSMRRNLVATFERRTKRTTHWGQLYINLNYSCTRTIIMPDVQPSQTFYLNSRSK